MINRDLFDRIRQRHGSHASWAIWADVVDTPTSGVGDLKILDLDSNPSLLQILRNDVVMVGLNPSRSCSGPFEAFRAFHDPRGNAKDFKIRHAFVGTPYYGAYMTDVIKRVDVNASNVLEFLKANAVFLKENIDRFLEELEDLQCIKPTILAFGADAHRLVKEHTPPDAYSRLVKLTHYSCRIAKEDYRQTVLREIGDETA